MTFEVDGDSFCESLRKHGAALVVRRRIDDLETPVSALLKLGAERPGTFLLESVVGGETKGRHSVIGLDPDLCFKIDNGQAAISRSGLAGRFVPQKLAPIAALRQLVRAHQWPLADTLPGIGAGLFGYLSYDMIRFVERLPDGVMDPLQTPDALLVRPRLVLLFDHLKHDVSLIAPVWAKPGADGMALYRKACARITRAEKALDTRRPKPRPNDLPPEPIAETANMTPAGFRGMVDKAKAYIRAGDIFQAVLSQRFSLPFAHGPFALYRSLRRQNPSPYMFYLNFGDHSVVGASPEILVQVKDQKVTIRPIAGTRPRGKTPAEDRALEEELLADPKELAEHLMLVDLGRNDVGRVAARPGHSNAPAQQDKAPFAKFAPSVKVTASFVVERYSHVMHIVSNVEAPLSPDKDAIDALFAGFPAGTLSGAPKVRAMEIINELEPHKRGIYGGGVGYFSANGDMDFAIALRTAIVKDQQVHTQAGAGVVLDSNAESERMETVHKSRAIIAAAADAIRYTDPKSVLPAPQKRVARGKP